MVHARPYRVPVDIDAELITGKIRYEGIIQNLSRSGVCVRTAPVKTAADFFCGAPLVLEFQIPSGETLDLHCEVRWSDKPDRLTRTIGMKIIEASPIYEEYYKTIYTNHMGMF